VCPLPQVRLLAQAPELLPPGLPHLLGLLTAQGDGALVDFQFRRRQGLQQGLGHVAVHRRRRNTLAPVAVPVALPQAVARVVGARAVVDPQLVTAFAAVKQTPQQGLPCPRHSAALLLPLVPVVFLDHPLDLPSRPPPPL